MGYRCTQILAPSSSTSGIEDPPLSNYCRWRCLSALRRIAIRLRVELLRLPRFQPRHEAPECARFVAQLPATAKRQDRDGLRKPSALLRGIGSSGHALLLIPGTTWRMPTAVSDPDFLGTVARTNRGGDPE